MAATAAATAVAVAITTFNQKTFVPSELLALEALDMCSFNSFKLLFSSSASSCISSAFERSKALDPGPFPFNDPRCVCFSFVSIFIFVNSVVSGIESRISMGVIFLLVFVSAIKTLRD